MKFSWKAWIGVVTMAVVLPGCDFFAQKELKVGQSTKEDVAKFMGRPEMMWAENDGSEQWEFVRGPMGDTTYMVDFGPDGKYRGMRNILTDAFFQKIKPDMSRDDVRRILGKPTEIMELKLKNEVVWRWRHQGDQQRTMMFDVHFTPEGKVKFTGKSDDPKKQAS